MTGAGERGALVLDGVSVELGGREVLVGVDLVVPRGTALGVTGPSGSGKSVLCLTAAGVLLPTRGRVELERASNGDAKSAVGLVLQTHGLMSGLTAEENVALPLQARRGAPLGRDEVARRAREALESLGLGEHSARSVDELSGGERQRVGIARALAGDPMFLIADEPTAELDVENRQRVLALLLALAARGRVVVIASDDPEVIGACSSVVHLDGGRIVAHE